MPDRDLDAKANFVATLAEAAKAPIPEGSRAARLMQHGSMSLLYYAPRGEDRQQPHDQDEVYIVATGSGTFFKDGERKAFGSGDVLFAEAGAEHRFEDFSDDFGTWVVFYGPKGGE